MVLSDNFPYHDMVRFSTYGDKLKYTYLVSFFPSKKNYYNDEGFIGTGNNDSTNTLDGLFFYSAHRFEARLFNDKLGFALTEGLIYASETNNIEFAALSPLYFMHNGFMPNNSNSTLAMELDWTPVKGLSVYGQILLDQFTMPGIETPVGPDLEEPASPNGTAYLVGGKYLMPLMNGVLTINPEFAYVSAFCYLRNGYNEKYGMDYVGAIRSRLYAFQERGLGTDILYEDYVIGYKYGPDCMVANLAATWEGEKLSLSANGMFIVHGTHDLWTKWGKVPAHAGDLYEQYTGPTSSHSQNDNYRYQGYYDAKTVRNSKWYTLDIGVGAKYRLLDKLQISLNIDYVGMWNIFNVDGRNASDIQFILGAKYECF